MADATGQDLSLGQEGGSDSQAMSLQDHIMWGWLLAPSVQAVTKGEGLTIAQLLVPKEFCCRGKIKGLKSFLPPKGSVHGIRASKGFALATTDPTPTRCHEVYWLRCPCSYEGILVARGPLELGWGAALMDPSPALSTWSTNKERSACTGKVFLGFQQLSRAVSYQNSPASPPDL